MNRCEAIRALIPNAESAMKASQIKAALPQYTSQQIQDALVLMYHHADPPILDRTGNKSEGFAYFVCRDVQIREYPNEEARRAAMLERELLRNRRRRGGGSLAELRQRQAEARAAKAAQPKSPRKGRTALAEFRAAQAAKREKKTADKAERARLRAEKRAAEQAAVAAIVAARQERDRRKKAAERAMRRLSPAQRVLAHAPAVVAADKPTQAAPVKPRMETVDEWMARTGKRPERIPAVWELAEAA